MKCYSLISAILHWIAQVALNITVFDCLWQNPLVYTFFFFLHCWHGWLICVNWCAGLYRGSCDQGQTRDFLLSETFLCCHCIETCYSSRANCYFHSVFTNFLLTPAIGCRFWDVPQCDTPALNCKFGLPRWGLTVQLQLPGVTAVQARTERVWI